MKNKLPLILFLLAAGIAAFFYFASQPVTKEQPTSITQADKNSFRFEKFSSRKELQAELDKLFPYGTPISEIDAVLVDKVEAFRSDNLIGNDKAKAYRKGTSSADNYVFYYKPVMPAGKNGWEDTSSGWAVKAIHGNIPRENDSEFDKMVGGGSKGLKEITALAVPHDAEDHESDKHITLIKEVLQYKIDMAPVETFDEAEWAELVAEHQNSPCMKELSYQCFIQQTLKLLDIPDDPARTSYLRFLADMTIEHGDIETAKILVNVWPEAESIREYEEGMPRLRRQTPVQIENTIRWFHIQYIQLLFLAGEYEEAEKLLRELHDEQKAGSDYGAINALVKCGALAQASKIAELTLEWKRETPDPKRNSSAHMHCNTYTNPKTRPAAMGDLALVYVENGDLDKAYDVAQLVKHYWENNAFGQSSYCYTNFAQSSYLSAMKALFKAYSKNGNKDKAHTFFQELQAIQQQQTEDVRLYTKGAFENLALVAAKEGITDSLEEMARFVEEHDEMDYPAIYNRNTNDPIAMIYALAGKHQKAIDRIESHNYSENKQPPSSLDKILGPDRDAPENEIKLTTYLKIAGVLNDIGDKEGALLFLDKATPYFNTRKPKYDAAVDNLSDYITKANILMDLGEKEKSREVLNELIEQYNKTTREQYRGGSITTSFYGQFAYLYARHENIRVVQEWADKLPSFYLGAYYARIAALLIEEKRWDELDTYFEEMARVFSTDESPTVNWRHFTEALIDAGELDRYLRFLDMLNKGSEEDHARQAKRMGTYITRKTPETPDTKKQIWMMNQLLVSKLLNNNVPSEVMGEIWPRYITNCRAWGHTLPRHGHERNKLPDAKETMAACYVGVIKSLETYRQFNN